MNISQTDNVTPTPETWEEAEARWAKNRKQAIAETSDPEVKSTLIVIDALCSVAGRMME
jgi:hypothetical protein